MSKPSNDQLAGPVLAATDFSDDSKAAVIWAARFAQMVGAEFEVLHVLHDPLDDPGYYRKSHDDPSVPMEQIAHDLLLQFVEDLAREHPEIPALGTAHARLVSGTPSSRIVETADALGARLIVMGRTGRSGLKGLLMGSKTKAVISHAQVPVTSVGAEREESDD